MANHPGEAGAPEHVLGLVGAPRFVGRPVCPGRFVAMSAVLRATLLTLRKSGLRASAGYNGSRCIQR